MLDVFFEDDRVGRIEHAGPLLSFTYDRGWLGNPDRFAISVTMPLAAETCSGEVATPWFANLLPEDRQLETIGRLLGRDPGDVYGLLERMGRDTAGALSIGGPEPRDAGRYHALDEAALADAIDRLPRRPLLAGEADITMSLAGAQSKLAVAVFDGRIHLPLNGAASTHILKPASQRLYATVENELLCLRLAAALGLPVAAAAMARAAGRPYLLVERFDRRIVGGHRVSRSHQEDLCQALGRYPTQKYESGRGPGLADLFAVLDRHARRPAADRLALLDLVIFAACIGDSDRHAKNYALMLAPGPVRLAPGYDLMTALAYDNVTGNLAMKVAGVSRPEFIERRHWERFAARVGLSQAAILRQVGVIATAVAARAEAVAREIARENDASLSVLTLFAERIARRADAVLAASRRGPSDRSRQDQ
ncbi:MAG: HipA domain-containing protein [Dongiaceae bacterium]